MTRLEDLAHAAFAQALKDDVTAENQVAEFPLRELIDLIGRHPAAANELARERFRFGKARGQIPSHLFDLLGREELALFQERYERAESTGRHRAILGAGIYVRRIITRRCHAGYRGFGTGESSFPVRRALSRIEQFGCEVRMSIAA